MRHKDPDVFMRYVAEAHVFRDNPLKAILES
jgi:hypothetical protein